MINWERDPLTVILCLFCSRKTLRGSAQVYLIFLEIFIFFGKCFLKNRLKRYFFKGKSPRSAIFLSRCFEEINAKLCFVTVSRCFLNRKSPRSGVFFEF